MVFIGLFLLIFPALVFADTNSIFWVNKNHIHNLEPVLTQLKQHTDLPILFPSHIPVENLNQELYVSLTGISPYPHYDQFWQINFDATPDCQGIKICNIGYISAAKQCHFNKFYWTLPDNKPHAKEQIALSSKTLGYYSPYHTGADSANPTLEWQSSGVCYRLAWRIPGNSIAQKSVLIELVNSLHWD